MKLAKFEKEELDVLKKFYPDMKYVGGLIEVMPEYSLMVGKVEDMYVVPFNDQSYVAYSIDEVLNVLGEILGELKEKTEKMMSFANDIVGKLKEIGFDPIGTFGDDHDTLCIVVNGEKGLTEPSPMIMLGAMECCSGVYMVPSTDEDVEPDAWFEGFCPENTDKIVEFVRKNLKNDGVGER